MPGRHVGQGVLVTEDDFVALKDHFACVWPWAYGSRAINSKNFKSMAHKNAYDVLISTIWPCSTEQKYFALEGFPPRAKFHLQRLAACVG